MGNDEEVMLLFLEESREHLDGIEDDLLTIEDQGANMDSELVNNVFRAMHTVKGGAGFFALNQVKDLAHAMENILDRVRQSELIPTSEIISQLLDGADLLKRMLADVDASREMDISTELSGLNAILHADPEIKEELETLVEILHPDTGNKIFELPKNEIAKAQHGDRGGQFVYLLNFDLIEDVEKKDKTPWEIVDSLHKTIVFIDSKIDVDAVGILDSEDIPTVPFYVLCATMLEPEIMTDFVELPAEKIKVIFDSKHALDAAAAASLEQEKSEAPQSPQAPPPEPPPQHEESLAVENPDDVTEPAPKVEPMASTPDPTPAATPAPEATPAPAASKPATKPASSPSAAPEAKGAPVAAGGDQTVRVHLKILDRLMALAGELVLTRNNLIESTKDNDPKSIMNAANRVDGITSQLQEAIMSTRMQTVGIVFNKFRRVVRDLSGKLAKKIDLKISGEDVDLDKTIIEAIGDPLTHLVRNSIDHGIETPDRRVASGKNETGTLHLKAFHEAGQVVIEIVDDGAGINPQKIGSLAIEKGVVTEEVVAQMNERELIRLIFRPGFSTAEEVSDISGRGVGMDVVQTNLAKVGGVIDIESTVGEGTTIRIKLPLTLAIIPSLLVSVSQERYAIPQVNLVELVRIAASEVKSQVEHIGDALVMRLRGELLPLIRLCDLLNISPTYKHPDSGELVEDRRENVADRRSLDEDVSQEIQDKRNLDDRRKSPESATNVVVVAAGEFRYGIIVDELLDSPEIVVKPLGMHLTHRKEYAGATILGDGSVALILDTPGIREVMDLKDTAHLHQVQENIEHKEHNVGADMQSLLLLENAEDEIFAVPLNLVMRIEKIMQKDIQNVGGRPAIQYRDSSLPLLSIESTADVKARKETEEINVVVFLIGNREVGLMVSDVHDIANTDHEVDHETYVQSGIMGSVILDEKIVLLLDIYGIVKHEAPEWLGENIAQASENGANSKVHSILVVEDSPFFRNQVVNIIEDAGYKVLSAEDGAKAIEVLQEDEITIDLIVSDIEMPVMNGLEMTRQIRAGAVPRYQDVPIMAVTSLTGDAAEAEGLEMGITEYQVKLDRDEIVASIRKLLNPVKA